MAKITYRTILVIGDNHKEIVKKYSADTKVTPYLKLRLDDAGKEQKNEIKLIEQMLTNNRIELFGLTELYEERYRELLNMSDFEYFMEYTQGCSYNEETGDAYTDENPKSFYQYERCHQYRLEKTGQEGDFSDPFPLKDGGISYSAHFNDIDWDKIHRNKNTIELNSRVWDMVVNDDEPENDTEERLKEQMKNKMKYFNQFKTKEDYINHSTNLWYWGVATEDGYTEVTFRDDPMEWITFFYNRFIAKLKKENPLITIYEVKALD